jgi:hypothetical protein
MNVRFGSLAVIQLITFKFLLSISALSAKSRCLIQNSAHLRLNQNNLIDLIRGHFCVMHA